MKRDLEPDTTPSPSPAEPAPVSKAEATARPPESETDAGSAPSDGPPTTAYDEAEPPSQQTLQFTNMWYYTDMQQGAQQGPYSSFEMRSWLTSGYMAPNTLVAPSLYGEVPETMWAITELWSNPHELAFMLAEEAAAKAVFTQVGPEFIACEAWEGAKPGYSFKVDFYGLGYYRDDPQPIEITKDELEEEARRKRQRLEEYKCARAMPGSPTRQ